MPIIVQKFGGTSVADAKKIRKAADRVIKAIKNGFSVVVVASARGKQTDQLVKDAL
ncbi:MAG: aspartate kinase, partial [Planctomycetes bacterium]|nr:aspartate kinase [Planctomycetota bacterium]